MALGITFVICLENNRTKWYPGSTGNGILYLKAHKHVNIRQIYVTFAGRIATNLSINKETETTNHWGNVSLFEHSQILLQGPFTLKEDMLQSYSFGFKIPHDCSSKQGDIFKPDSCPFGTYDNSFSQVLPPSFVAFQQCHGSQKSCSVSYNMIATLEVDQGPLLEPDNITRTISLDVLPLRREESPDLHIVPTSHRLYFSSLKFFALSKIENPRRSLKVTMRRLMNSWKTEKHPLAIYDFVTQLPNVGVIGQPLPITLGVEYDVPNSTAQVRPPMGLEEFSITLVCHTKQITMGGTSSSLTCNDDRSTTWSDEETFVHWTGNANISNSLDLRTLCELHFPLRFVPTFKTFSISRSYTLKFKCAIECALELRRFEVVLPNFVVLSSEYLPEPAEDTCNGNTKME